MVDARMPAIVSQRAAYELRAHTRGHSRAMTHGSHWLVSRQGHALAHLFSSHRVSNVGFPFRMLTIAYA